MVHHVKSMDVGSEDQRLSPPLIPVKFVKSPVLWVGQIGGGGGWEVTSVRPGRACDG